MILRVDDDVIQEASKRRSPRASGIAGATNGKSNTSMKYSQEGVEELGQLFVRSLPEDRTVTSKKSSYGR
jgi:hypothetical protein